VRTTFKSWPLLPTLALLQHGLHLDQRMQVGGAEVDAAAVGLGARQLRHHGNTLHCAAAARCRRVTFCWLHLPVTFLQIIVYCASALASGALFYRWLRIGEAERQGVWSLYGWFSGLMFFGSCFGVVTWAAWMQSLSNAFIAELSPSLSPDQRALFWALSDRWNGVFRITYAIEFLCLCVAKLFVLDRMSLFAAAGWLSKHWVVVRRILMVIVVGGNLAGLASNIAAAVYFEQVADSQTARSAALASNNTAAAQELLVYANDQYNIGLFASSVQAFCEVAVLLIIVLAFAVVGAACVRRVRAALATLEHSGSEMQNRLRKDVVVTATAKGRQMQKEVVFTTSVVFVTFLIRSVYSTFYAVAYKLQNFANIAQKCPGTSVCDEECFNVYTHIYFWMIRTPEFQLIVVLISKPLPLLVVLYGMTTGRMRHGTQTQEPDVPGKWGRVLSKLAFWKRSPSQPTSLLDSA
jgi:hypothetical protein